MINPITRLTNKIEALASAVSLATPVRKSCALLLLVTGLWCLVLIQGVDVTSVMEARNLRTAEEIVENDAWLLPTLNGELRILKPPLPTWTVALMAKLSGDTRNLFLLRLPSLAVALLLAWFIFLLVSDCYGRRAALLSVLALVTNIQMIGEIQTARWDLFVCTFATGMLWAMTRAYRLPGQAGRYSLLAIILGIASYLSKGPVGILFVALPYFLALWLWNYLEPKPTAEATASNLDRESLRQATPRTWRQAGWFTIVIAASLFLGNAWWLLVWFHYPDTWRLLMQDVAGVNSGSHTEAIYAYLLMAPPLMAPWTLLFLSAVACWFMDCRQWWRQWRAQRTAGNSATNPAASHRLFPGIWFVVGLILLSFTPAKKNRYFLLLWPSLAVFMGIFLEQLISDSSLLAKRRWLQWVINLQVWAVAAVTIVMPIGLGVLAYYGAAATIWAFAPLFLVLGWALFRRTANAAQAIVATSLAVVATTTVIFLYFPQTRWYPTGYEEANRIKAIAGTTKLYLVGGDSPKLLWAMSKSYHKLQPEHLPAQPWPAFFLVDGPSQAACAQQLQQAQLKRELVYRFSTYEHRRTESWYLYRVSR